MDKRQVTEMEKDCRFPDSCKNSNIFQTHISWVVLTDNYAFKIKRPVKFSFLDFSTLEKRKYYCDKEIALNKRLAPEMYLDVLPVDSDLRVGETDNDELEIIEYAVRMKRMDNDREMDKLLKQDKVSQTDIENVAAKIAQFHKSARIIKDAFNTTGFQEKYEDILSVEDYIREHFGEQWVEKIRKCVDISKKYLNRNRSYFNERAITGLRRDCHGDLKASNIFLYDDPVIFDCIEFNEDYRIIDILNEIAFLCVDLDFYGKGDLSRHFYKTYLDAMKLEEDEDSRFLMGYFKSYRANVEAKLKAIRSKKNTGDIAKKEEIKKLLGLMFHYLIPEEGDDIPQSV